MKKTRKIFNLFSKYKAYIVLTIVALCLLFIGYEYYSRYFFLFKDPKKIKAFIMSYDNYGVLAFILLQILQVIAFFIPGEVIQIAGGYIYGVAYGSLISLVGITIGSSITYFISNRFGKPFVQKIISERQLKLFDKLLKLEGKKGVVFLLYLIPGLPKDVLGYISGISNISYVNFLIYSTLGRIPGIIISAYFGDVINIGDYKILIIIAIIMSLLFIIGVIKGEKIIKKISE